MAATLFMISGPASAQNLGIYAEPLHRISDDVREGIAGVARMSAYEREHALDIRFQMYETSKALRQIEQNARRRNNALVDGGAPQNRELLYAASVAVQLSAAQEMLGRYLDLGDRIFLTNAQTSLKMAEDMAGRQ